MNFISYMTHKLPQLPYAYNYLEPYIDEQNYENSP